MLERQKRLNEVYEHLHDHWSVHTKGDFADKIGYARAYVSSALNGNEKYLTDKLFIRICDKYEGLFNLGYLLHGNGQLLTPEEESKSSEIEKAANRPSDQSAAFDNLIEIFSRVIRESDDIRVEMKTDMVEIRTLKEDLHQAIYDFRDATYRLTQALKSINGNNATIRPIDMAAEDETNTDK